MRRIKLVIAALALVVATFAAFSSLGMAEDLNCQDAWGDWISCDGTYYAPVDNGWDNSWGNGWDNSWGNGWDNPWGNADFSNCLFLPALTIC